MFKSNSSTINFEEIRMIIYNDLLSTMEDNYEYYKNYKLDVSLEQDFIKREKMTPDTIYVVIKFSQATVNYGQTTLPVTITALSISSCFI